MSYEMRDRIAAVINDKKNIHEPIGVARMVLEEMSKPTDAMIEAALPTLVRYLEDSLEFSDRDAIEGIWRAMITCALRDRRATTL